MYKNIFSRPSSCFLSKRAGDILIKSILIYTREYSKVNLMLQNLPKTYNTITKSRGFPPTSEIKKYHIKRKQEGDPVKDRGQNIPLVTDTGSGM